MCLQLRSACDFNVALVEKLFQSKDPSQHQKIIEAGAPRVEGIS
jgi:hypothetical protein